MQVRTVTVELLRPGPAHNQLLSPLTQYLGICDDAEAGIVTQPYEQATFLRRMSALVYGADGTTAERLAMLRELGYDVGRILGAIPRLPGSLTAEPGSTDALIHLRLMLSASELATLPFELAKVPINPGSCADAWLSLQVRTPVVITRRTRNVSAAGVKWPLKPRILFVSADPDEDGVPFDDHRQLLLDAIRPFQMPGKDDAVVSDAGRREQFGSLLTILKGARFDDVVNECARERYTHVHFLAHGARDDDQGEHTVYGMSLGGTVVSADRLASALTGLVGGQIHRPAVVTLATCDSGRVGNVMVPGASIAHVLHQAGIPLVIASQVPLSKAGSVLLFREFFARLMWGDDLWTLLHRLRTTLHGRLAALAHDWASVVVYEALPDNLAAQLEEVRYLQGKLAIDVVFERVQRPGVTSSDYRALTRELDRLMEALPCEGRFAMECQGLKASARKRQAQAEFSLAQSVDVSAADQRERLLQSCFYLDAALHEYEQAARGFLVVEGLHAQRFATMHWVMVQQLALSAVLGKAPAEGIMAAAYLSADAYLEHPDLMEQCWAHGSRAELELLQLAYHHRSIAAKDREEIRESARWHAREVVRLARRSNRAWAIQSTRRQFERYVHWWSDPAFESVVMSLLLGSAQSRTRDGKAPRPDPDAPGMLRADRDWHRNGVAELAASLVDILDDPTTRAATDPGVAYGGNGGPSVDASISPYALTQATLKPFMETRARSAASGTELLERPAASTAAPTVAKGVAAKTAKPARATGGSARKGSSAAPAPDAGAAPVGLFRIEMLAADYGDALIIEYGTPDKPARVLVDCGTSGSFKRSLKPRLEKLDPNDRRFELLILSHIDDDHIGGAIDLLTEAQALGVQFGDIWFNGWKHIQPYQSKLNARQGEEFSQLIRQQKRPWNQWRKGGTIVVPATGALPRCTLPGGLQLTLLSPSEAKLGDLAEKWEKAIRALGKTPGADEFLGARAAVSGSTDIDALAASPFTPDGAEANGSSIAVLAEYGGRRILLGADAHAPVLVESLQRLTGGTTPLPVDAFKLPHHGSRNNLSVELLRLLRCRDYLVSTSGDRFQHPDREAIARVVVHGGPGARLHFNYRSDINRFWADPALQAKHGYTARYPEATGTAGLVVTL